MLMIGTYNITICINFKLYFLEYIGITRKTRKSYLFFYPVETRVIETQLYYYKFMNLYVLLIIEQL